MTGGLYIFTIDARVRTTANPSKPMQVFQIAVCRFNYKETYKSFSFKNSLHFICFVCFYHILAYLCTFFADLLFMRNSFSGKPLSATAPCQNVANEVANYFGSIFEVDLDKL